MSTLCQLTETVSLLAGSFLVPPGGGTKLTRVRQGTKERDRGVTGNDRKMTTKECQRAAKRPMGANAESSKTEGVNSHRTVKLPNSQQQLGQRAGQPPVGSHTLLQGLPGPRRL